MSVLTGWYPHRYTIGVPRLRLNPVRYLTLCCILLLSLSMAGQEPVPVRAEKARAEARAWKSKQKPERALKALDEAIRLHPDYYEALADRAALLLERDPAAAEADLLHLTRLQPDKDLSVWLALARIAAADQRIEEALGRYDRYLQGAGPEHRMFLKITRERENTAFRHEALRHPVPFDPEPAGPGINDPQASQYGPMLTADGQVMIFTRRQGGQEDFWLSRRSGEDWKDAAPLHNLNTPLNEGMHTISRDGRTMIFTWCHDRQGLGSCDLYLTRQTGEGMWSKPENLGTTVNSRSWDAQPTLSADGRTLIFASNRAGGVGESDLWWSRLGDDGQWQSPEPLPGKINTPGKEQSPFLHADGRTLYFGSDGHPGMGDMDIYMSRLDPDTGWSQPVNLGYPINTDGHDGALSLELDGRTGWFATDRLHRDSGRRGLFIYRFTLPEDVRGTPVTFVDGKIRDRQDGKPLSAEIHIRALADGEEETLIYRADQQGRFLVCMASGRDYALHVDHPGYSFHSEHFRLTDSSAFRPYPLDIGLNRLERMETEVRVVLRNIHFPSGSDRFLAGSETDLERVLRLMTENPAIRIRLEGHTDDIGHPEENLRLSERRASAVRNWLISRGIAEDRLESRGFGQTQPLADNAGAEGRQMNRRTEMVIIR